MSNPKNSLWLLVVVISSPVWLPLMLVFGLWELLGSAREWLSWRYRFSDCVGCGSPYCPNVGPWHARRRLFVYCPACMPELYAKKP